MPYTDDEPRDERGRWTAGGGGSGTGPMRLAQPKIPILSSREDYGGEHAPPGPEEGAPLHDLTGAGKVYPDDVYSSNAVRYYGTGEDRLDAQSMALAQSLKGRPDAQVTIYRAIPNDLTTADKLANVERDMAYVMKHGTIPPNADWPGAPGPRGSAYYNHLYAERDKLRALPVKEESAPHINRGDWVTINRQYAKDHGEGALNGRYRILSKRVRAREIFTNGDSIHEWGYWPSSK